MWVIFVQVNQLFECVGLLPELKQLPLLSGEIYLGGNRFEGHRNSRIWG
jgi:hypothetical protein